MYIVKNRRVKNISILSCCSLRMSAVRVRLCEIDVIIRIRK